MRNRLENLWNKLESVEHSLWNVLLTNDHITYNLYYYIENCLSDNLSNNFYNFGEDLNHIWVNFGE